MGKKKTTHDGALPLTNSKHERIAQELARDNTITGAMRAAGYAEMTIDKKSGVYKKNPAIAARAAFLHRKITELPSTGTYGAEYEDPLSDPKKELLAREMASGKSIQEAMRIAGYAPGTISSHAGRYQFDDDIAGRTVFLQRQYANAALITRDDVIFELMRDRDALRGLKEYASSANVTMNIARVAGVVVNRTALDSRRLNELSDEELATLLGDAMGAETEDESDGADATED